MKYSQAKELLHKDIDIMSFEKLLKYKVKLLDAWRESRADYGMNRAVELGYYKVMASESCSGFSPRDIWLTSNLSVRLEDIEKILKTKYNNLYR